MPKRNADTSTVISMMKSIEYHAAAQISAATVFLDPTPFIVVDNFFPDTWYQEILRIWPTFTNVKSHELAKYSYPGRRVLRLSEKSPNVFEPHQWEMWTAVSRDLTRRPVVESIIHKFPKEIVPRLRENGNFTLDARLTEDRVNYSLGPHTDQPQKVYSIIIYTANDCRHEHFGTRFYKPLNPGLTDDGNTHFPFTDFIEAGIAPYLPNTAVIFPRTKTSFHGVPKLNDPNFVRRAIMVNAYN